MAESVYLPRLRGVAPFGAGLRFGTAHGVVREGDGRDPLHLHGYAEIFYNVKGEVTFLVDGRPYTLRPGEGIVCRAGSVHVCRFPPSAVQEHYCLWLAGEETEELLPSRAVFSLSEEAGAAAVRLFERLGEGETPLAEMAHLCELLLLFRGGEGEDGTSDALPEALTAVLAHVRESYATVGTVEHLAAAHYMSCATLTRLFRRHLGITPRVYLESVKLSHAAELLQEGASVTDAALRAGFSDCSHFIALFRRRFGKTPLKFRRRCAEGEAKEEA